MIGKLALASAAAAIVGIGIWSYAGGSGGLGKLMPAALHSPDANSKSAKTAKKRAPVPVKVAIANTRTIPIRLEGVGTVKARSKVAVKTRVDGQLFEATVKDGQLVRRGDLLFRLDPRPFEVLVKQAEANLARDRANYDKAINDLQRFQSLTSKGISPKTREDDTKSLVAALAATVRSAEAALELARLNLGYATIRSPLDGRVGTILVSPGNMVRSNDPDPLLVITELSPVYVAFALPEKHLDDVRKRLARGELQVDVKTMGGSTSTVSGSLYFINNEVDTATGTIQVQARFANEDRRLIPGQFAQASVLLDELKDAVTVPTRAIQINRKGYYLWVAGPDKTAELRMVTVGPDSGQETAITGGLKAGEMVVTDGQLRLFPKARVLVGGDQSIKGRKNGRDGKALPTKAPATDGTGTAAVKVKS